MAQNTMWQPCIQCSLEISVSLEGRLLESISPVVTLALPFSSRGEEMGVLRFSFLSPFQGYYRAGYSLLQLLQHYEAARMFLEGLRRLQSSQDQTQVADFLVGVFTTMGSKLDMGRPSFSFPLPASFPTSLCPSFPFFFPSSSLLPFLSPFLPSPCYFI